LCDESQKDLFATRTQHIAILTSVEFMIKSWLLFQVCDCHVVSLARSEADSRRTKKTQVVPNRDVFFARVRGFGAEIPHTRWHFQSDILRTAFSVRSAFSRVAK
jgi:hypothetical protein